MTRLKLDLRLCTAAVAVVVAGALTGAAVGEAPILKRGETAYPTASAHGLIGDYRPDPRDPPADHYPLVTPDGTVPVAQLALHGRLRNLADDRAEYGGIVTVEDGGLRELSDREIAQLASWSPAPQAAAGLAAQYEPDAGDRPAPDTAVAEPAPSPAQPRGPKIVSPTATASPALELERPITLQSP